MATRTRAQLRQRVAEILGIVGAGQALPAEEYALINDLIEEGTDQLSLSAVITISDLEEIEGAAFQPLAEYIANFGGRAWGKAFDPNVERAMETRLRMLANTVPSKVPVKQEYY